MTMRGEFQMAAWEMGAGRYPHWGASLFCAPLIVVGLVWSPSAMWRAYRSGRNSQKSLSRARGWRSMTDDPFLQTLLPTTHDLGGFKVHRTLPHRERTTIGPFIFFDQMGPAQLAPGTRHRRPPAPAYQPRHRHLSVRRRDRPSRFARHLRDDRARRGQPDDRGQGHHPFASARRPRCAPDGPGAERHPDLARACRPPRRRSTRPSSMSPRTSCRWSRATAPAPGW